MNRSFSALALCSLASSLISGCGEPPPPSESPWGSTGGMVVNTGGSGAVNTGGTGTGGMNPNEPQSSVCGSADAAFTIRADESTNMSLYSDLGFVPTVAAGSDLTLTFDWSAVDTDFFGHPIDWTQMKMATLVAWGVPTDQIADLINEDSADLTKKVLLPPAQFSLATGAKQAVITDFIDAGGSPIPQEDLVNDYLNPAKNYTYTLILQDEVNAGVGARMIQAFTLENGNPTTTITIQNTSTTLEAHATFGQPSLVPAANPNIWIDWESTIATRSFGGNFDPSLITEVIIGQYDPTVDLQQGILDLETAYKTLYRGKVDFLEPYNLSTLVSDGTNLPFPGIDGTDQWFVGLICGKCSNPSPWYLSKLTPCP